MVRMTRLILGLVVGLVLGLTISALATTGFQDGAGWQAQSESYRLGYIAGSVDMVFAVNANSTDAIQSAKACLNSNPSWTLGNIEALMRTYFVAHPDAAQYTMASDVLVAIDDVCDQ